MPATSTNTVENKGVGAQYPMSVYRVQTESNKRERARISALRSGAHMHIRSRLEPSYLKLLQLQLSLLNV